MVCYDAWGLSSSRRRQDHSATFPAAGVYFCTGPRNSMLRKLRQQGTVFAASVGYVMFYKVLVTF